MNIIDCSTVSGGAKDNQVANATIPRSAPSKEEQCEIVKMGEAIYEQCKQTLETFSRDKFVSIDVDNMECAVADSPIVAAKILLHKNPHARLYGARIGHTAMFSL